MGTSHHPPIGTTRASAGAAVGAFAAAILAAAQTASAAGPDRSPSVLVNSTGRWAPAGTATIHPGVMVLTKGAECTANFVYTAAGRTYLGQAAHCSGTGQATDTNGCTAKSLPLGTPVTIVGSGVTGTLAYNSWLLMQKIGESDPDRVPTTTSPRSRSRPPTLPRSAPPSRSSAAPRG